MRKVPERFTLIVICVPAFTATALFLFGGTTGRGLFPLVSVTDIGIRAKQIPRESSNSIQDDKEVVHNKNPKEGEGEGVGSSFMRGLGRGNLNDASDARLQQHQQPASRSNAMCQHIQHYDSLASLVHRLQEPLVNASLKHFTGQVYRSLTVDAHTLDTIHQGLQRLMELFTPDRVRSSFMHPMPAETSLKVANILHKRLQDPQNNPPLHIMMFGGSIVAGVDSSLYHQGNVTLNGDNWQARSTSQWQIMLDTVFPSGAVVVTNMGVGGMPSDVASVALEYAVWPPGYPAQGPDIVVCAHGVNDVKLFANPAIQPDESVGYKNILHANHVFLKAAYGNRCDGLPAVIFVDDAATVFDNKAAAITLLHSRAVSELATWHDVMAVSYTRAFMKYTFSDATIGASTSREQPSAQVLFAWNQYPPKHPTLFFHTGMSWLLTLSILQTMQEHCQDEAHPQPTRNDNETNHSFQQLNPRLMPEFTRDRAPGDVAIEWKNATAEWAEKCSDPAFVPGNTCSYFWLVHSAAGVTRRRHVYTRIKPVASFIDGWKAQGHPTRTPRTGWDAMQPNASFEIKVLARTLPIRQVSILYMKSYGDAWKDSRLRVDLTVVGDGDKNSTNARTGGGELMGIHNSSTSISYTDSFPVNATVGETVVARFLLVGGSTFKISGLFFCAS